MTVDEAFYDVRERTENPAHASVEDVCELVRKRAQDPRDDHMNSHFDEAMADIVERHGIETVQTVIRRILVEHYPFRTATVDLEMRNVDGVWIGTAATGYLRELNSEQDS
ncbi:hypothetical protein [Halobacterium salinarum]|uniref:DUF8158 domain-containing protein n=3 Tax=Halobacterium salinarum NRC-34001 TaxID=2886895 RepID=A0A510NBC7_HALSA|nr:hypothetical protein [Halobacterium salinarum]MDL0122112.1 hypothetical protein [Halobacterium salinarum]MDL0128477.1 hypothetical protein [Halobacterium salinarum]MDL0142527.1 hypothetical protein [Halobacterium salinarum]CAP15250.1 uncharacterized protein OE_6095R [Halobacterium salinarum R1]DAC79984.1 TPA_inf: uncharacterized protein VNG_6409H [Halobacterium salinarum NRC-1]